MSRCAASSSDARTAHASTNGVTGFFVWSENIDCDQLAPAFTQAFLQDGWGVGKSQPNGMDSTNEVPRVTRTLTELREQGVTAESYYVVATNTEPQSGREQPLVRQWGDPTPLALSSEFPPVNRQVHFLPFSFE
jgi:hypothetical protein